MGQMSILGRAQYEHKGGSLCKNIQQVDRNRLLTLNKRTSFKYNDINAVSFFVS